MVRPFGVADKAILLDVLLAWAADRDGTSGLTQYDIKNHKIFLKKIQYPQINLSDLFIGNVVVCYNRQLKIVAFGDEFTRKQLVGEDNSNK